MFQIADTVRNQDDSSPKVEKPRDPNIIAVG
jgi:hypothetical protein